jgi:hypothetical protein
MVHWHTLTHTHTHTHTRYNICMVCSTNMKAPSNTPVSNVCPWKQWSQKNSNVGNGFVNKWRANIILCSVMAYYWLLLLFLAKYKRANYVPRPGSNAPLAARNTDVISTARLLRFVRVCGAGDWDKICSACDQYEIQYTEWRMNANNYTYNFTQEFLCTSCSIKHTLIIWQICLKNSIYILLQGIIFTKWIST